MEKRILNLIKIHSENFNILKYKDSIKLTNTRIIYLESEMFNYCTLEAKVNLTILGSAVIVAYLFELV